MDQPPKPKKTKGAAPDQESAPFKSRLVKQITAKHIRKVCHEIAENGLALRNTTGKTQHATLPKVLAYFGPRGLNTYEGTAAGYARLATRIKELKESWEIHTLRENVVGPDGLYHANVGRYVLIGRRADCSNAQGSLDLGAAE
jgi:hypothetical protein